MIVASIASRSSDKNRDGDLVLVHPDRTSIAILPSTEFSSLRAALDSWDVLEPRLRAIDAELRSGEWPDIAPITGTKFLAPLPRTWALLDGSAFVQHVLLVRKARGAEPPTDLYTIPLMYQGASDNLLGPNDDIPLLDPSFGMDFESEVAIVTDSIPMGTSSANASKHVKLLLLMNDVSLRELIPRELATGFGFFQSKPPSSFSPFAVTPDELGDDWQDGRLHLPLKTILNDTVFGQPNAGQMHFSFFDLIAHAAKTRPLSAGTIIGSGTVSNTDESVGSSCLVEQRMIEKIRSGNISTPYLSDGDSVRISVSKGSCNVFGTIDQKVRLVTTSFGET